MKTKTDGNDSAYAVFSDSYASYGLTKREYFAAMAMQTFVSAEEVGYERQKDKNANPYNTSDKPTPRSEMQIHADIWVRKAEALIAALNK